MIIRRSLKVVISLLIIGGAVVVLAGLWMADQNRKAIAVELERIGYHASLHAHAVEGMGGNGVFTDSNGGKVYRLPEQLEATGNAAYSIVEITDEFITIRAVSRVALVGEIVARIDREGKVDVVGRETEEGSQEIGDRSQDTGH
jgi:hypothetical protein